MAYSTTYNTSDAARDITRCLGFNDLPENHYNVLVYAFNASTCVLAAGAVAALFASFSASCVFVGLGLLLRSITEKELFVAQRNSFNDGEDHTAAQAVWHNIFGRMPRPPRGWDVDSLQVFGYTLFKNTV